MTTAPSPVAPYCSNCFGTDTVCEKHASRVGEPDTAAVEPPGDLLLAAIRECAEDYRARSRLPREPIVVDVPVEAWKAASREEVEQLCAAGLEFHVLCGTCASTGFVCENHPNEPWQHLAGYGCGCGAGRPCGVCNKPWKPTAVHNCDLGVCCASNTDAAAVAALAAGEYPAFRDDPTPTTGPPSDYYYFPDGCRCHIRDDIDYGEHYSPPPDGCPAHTPWAFSGYSLPGNEVRDS